MPPVHVQKSAAAGVQNLLRVGACDCDGEKGRSGGMDRQDGQRRAAPAASFRDRGLKAAAAAPSQNGLAKERVKREKGRGGGG